MFELEAKKTLGQNFLNNKNIIQKIALKAKDICEKENIKYILEIGPGTGALTEYLLETGFKVIAIELDNRAIPLLKNKFSKYKNFELIHDDIRNLENIKLPSKYIVIANIPYYLSGFIIRNFLESNKQPKQMLLMIQKEVANRILDKKNSLLSLGVKSYGKPSLFMNVSKGNFTPAPKVDSALLLIENINKDIFKNDKIEKLYFELLKKAFASKRKQLGHNLKSYKDKIDKKYLTKRAEDLNINDWINILNSIYLL